MEDVPGLVLCDRARFFRLVPGPTSGPTRHTGTSSEYGREETEVKGETFCGGWRGGAGSGEL